MLNQLYHGNNNYVEPSGTAYPWQELARSRHKDEKTNSSSMSPDELSKKISDLQQRAAIASSLPNGLRYKNQYDRLLEDLSVTFTARSREIMQQRNRDKKRNQHDDNDQKGEFTPGSVLDTDPEFKNYDHVVEAEWEAEIWLKEKLRREKSMSQKEKSPQLIENSKILLEEKIEDYLL